MGLTKFKDKTVIITGASSGVGAACAKSFAELEANLVLVARNEQRLNAIKEELQDKTKVYTVAMDVADTKLCRILMEKAEAKFGEIHVLINNAGAHNRGDVENLSTEEIIEMVDVNFRAPLQLTREVLPYIQKAGEGAIIMTGSLSGRVPLSGAATYCATKAGLRSFTYALADELRDSRIAIGVVSPGLIDTGFVMNEIDEVDDIVYSQPVSTVQQVADAIIRLAKGKHTEIVMPWISGKWTTLAYLSPRLRRMSRGFLSWVGKKKKNKYRNR